VWADMNTTGFNVDWGKLRIARSFSVIAVKLFKLFNFFFFYTSVLRGNGAVDKKDYDLHYLLGMKFFVLCPCMVTCDQADRAL
jgi:hypothetical protein